MSLDSEIRTHLREHPNDWAWQGRRFLIGPGVRLVLPDGGRWSFVVGERVGYVRLSMMTHLCIELAWALKGIPDLAEDPRAQDPESASPYGVGNGPAPERAREVSR